MSTKLLSATCESYEVPKFTTQKVDNFVHLSALLEWVKLIEISAPLAALK
jgi:hypothetical protein